jgi:RNA 2',3'-cyclic 3'-phosphodiesterase
LFVAVPLPDAASARVAEVVDRIRAEGLAGAGRDVRWVRLDGLHLTLRFLGPTLDERLGAAIDSARSVAARSAAFHVTLGGAGTFPSPQRPRAIWIGLKTGAAEMSALADSIDAALTTNGWRFDSKPFRAHLTLARSDGVAAGSVIGARLVELAAALEISFEVDRIGVYESLTGGGPARYEPVDVISLTGA